mgnify:CR=1 FL=1
MIEPIPREDIEYLDEFPKQVFRFRNGLMEREDVLRAIKDTKYWKDPHHILFFASDPLRHGAYWRPDHDELNDGWCVSEETAVALAIREATSQAVKAEKQLEAARCWEIARQRLVPDEPR